ncbi:MAG TPA: lipopolysaccharide heptosyltransferase family protein [Pricia antarctica]|uniref:Lipopolysaccharide heptosyltransferase family protein n=2 Tax=root TaxID=1 RepID=A0A831QMX6_9FLAO|nr:lipopolysaccharide heptosyltransferase family protein [Pricia antarctica]
MGDVAMTVPVLSVLTHQYPDLKVTVLTKPFFAPLFAQLKNVSVFEAQVKGKHSGVFGLWSLYKELQVLKIDAVADLHNVLRSKVLKRYFKFEGIPFFQIDKARAEKKALTATHNKVFKPLKTTFERYADVFEALGFPINLSISKPLSVEPLSEKTLNVIGKKSKKFVGVAPFAAFEGKKYPPHLMESVLEKLNNTNKYTILLFGGGDEEEKKLDGFETRFESCINLAGKLSFSEEISIISNLEVMLSMDSGNGHLAAMYGVPVITLWGVTHPYAGFYPFGQKANNALLADREKYPLVPTSIYGNKMPKGYEKAIATISPEKVFEKIENILIGKAFQ